MFKNHIPTLDGLRGFAAIWVVLAHLDEVGLPELVPGQTGEYGVFLFFILSGFLMGHLYLKKDFHVSNALDYSIARGARIVPIYYLTIIGCAILSIALGKQFIYYLDAKDVIRHVLFVGNKYVFWSIGPEVQFYVVFLAIWWIFDKTKSSMTSIFPTAIFIISVLLFIQPLSPGTIVFSKLHIFLAGVFIASLTAHLPPSDSLSKSPLIIATQVAIIGIITWLTFTPYMGHGFGTHILNPNNLTHDKSFNAIYGDYRWVFLFSTILFIMAIGTKFSLTIFANKFAKMAGNYSFSIYLLHVPIMMAAINVTAPFGLSTGTTTAIALASVAAIGPISYALIEKPSQSWFRKKLKETSARIIDNKSVKSIQIKNSM